MERGVPAVGTRGLFLLETRISQEVDKTACTHQVSVGTLRWKTSRQSNKVYEESGKITVDGKWEEAKHI